MKQEIPNVINETEAINILEKHLEPFNFILVQEVIYFVMYMSKLQKSFVSDKTP